MQAKPDGEFVAGDRVKYNPVHLTTAPAEPGNLAMWVHFGTLGWEYVANCPYVGGEIVDIEAAGAWKGHPSPFFDRLPEEVMSQMNRALENARTDAA